MRFDRPARLLSPGQRAAQEAYFLERGEREIEKCKGEDVTAEEWTDPADGQKEVFFRNLFSTLSEPRHGSRGAWIGELRGRLQVVCVMWELDNYVVLVDLGGSGGGGWRAWGEAALTYTVMGLLMVVGRMWGCRAVSKEYTPEHLVKRWESGHPKGE